MVARQLAPVLGAQGDPYLLRHEWQLQASYRSLRSDKEFLGTVILPFSRRQEVINRQQILNLGATYAVTRQWNVTLDVPYLVYGSQSFPIPFDPPGQRFVTSAEGLGDISAIGRYWLLNTERHRTGNVALGLGVKFPTGNSDARDLYPDSSGANPSVQPVDQPLQPGDGGFGIHLELQAFRQLGSATLFASGTYLINPRNTNGTATVFASDLPPRARVLSVPDQYLARIGVAVPVPQARGLSVSLAARIEGVPVEDLVGANRGYRAPGYAIFVEPGLTYTRRRHTWSLSVPVATQRNVQGIGLGIPATLADYFLLVGYSYRFGGRRQSPPETGAKKAAPGANSTWSPRCVVCTCGAGCSCCLPPFPTASNGFGMGARAAGVHRPPHGRAEIAGRE